MEKQLEPYSSLLPTHTGTSPSPMLVTPHQTKHRYVSQHAARHHQPPPDNTGAFSKPTRYVKSSSRCTGLPQFGNFQIGTFRGPRRSKPHIAFGLPPAARLTLHTSFIHPVRNGHSGHSPDCMPWPGRNWIPSSTNQETGGFWMNKPEVTVCLPVAGLSPAGADPVCVRVRRAIPRRRGRTVAVGRGPAGPDPRIRTDPGTRPRNQLRKPTPPRNPNPMALTIPKE